jgi:putative membrane protein
MTYVRWSMLILLLATPAAFAQSNAKEAPVPEQKEQSTAEEAQVLAKLHHANKMEIDAGQLAKDNSDSPKVKAFGERLIKDHTQADETVRHYAEGHGIELKEPTTRSPQEEQEKKQSEDAMDKLGDLKGPEFDRAFSTMMLTDHQKAIQMVKAARDSSKNAEFRAMLGKLLPVLQQHRNTAQSLAQQTQH